MNENIAELFAELREALDCSDIRHAYIALRFVQNRAVDIALRETSVQFAGLFAKINYLLTERGAKREFMQAMAATRNRIRHQSEASEEGLQKSRPFDTKNLAQFIALVLDAEVPNDLRERFPQGTMLTTWVKADTRYLRVFVRSVGEGEIIATAANAQDEVRIVYGKGNPYLADDCSYLAPLLKEGTQLNLVHPRQREDGALLPELIIFEPDYLIDISTIASSFREYGTTPLTNLLHKIQPSRNTKATLLGDFASQLLDEQLHGLADRDYAESVGEFCRQRALAMAACEELDASFHTDAQRQRRNIAKAIGKDLPQAIAQYKAEEVLLEPSFVSEMLGIQGRMDFLQADYSLVIEQKSGKAGFVPGAQGFQKPALSTPHFVQLLLYRALLHYNHNMPNERIRPLLLYSKYDNPLLQTDSAPKLLHEAFRLRNQLVWFELHLADKGFSVLERLKADDLNRSGAESKLWKLYTRPDIEHLLQPMHAASPLESAYVLRMLRFVQREHVLSKIGNKRKENSGFAARWHDSLQEKRQAGNIYDGLKLSVPDGSVVGQKRPAPSTGQKRPAPDGSVVGLRILFPPEAQTETANFRVGDIVILYPYQLGTEPDCRATMLHRASIEEITTEGMTLRLRAKQTNARAFDTRPGWAWAMEHDFMESSYASLYRGIYAFLSASRARRDLILSQRHPETDETATLRGDYGAFNPLALRVRQAQELFLIIGPPGTGKTSFGMLNTLKEELLQPEASVAAMAFTNRAVDEICSKLVEEGIDFIRIGSEVSCAKEYRQHHLSQRIAGLTKIADIRNFIRSQRVVVGTTTAFNAAQELFALRSFSLAIIDEASQILEPHLLGLLSARHADAEAIKKVVMIGDHKQLPAVVQQTPEESRTDNPLLSAINLNDCRLSLFERLLATYRDDPSVVYMLRHQGRMHAEIADFPNRHFYEGKLDCVPLPHQVEDSPAPRVAFVNVERPLSSPSDKVNPDEAQAIAKIVAETYAAAPADFNANRTIGIIVPYRNQISAVRSAIIAACPQLAEVMPTIDTVERFQGSQRETIVYGFTVQRPYQLDFLTDNCFEENGRTIDRKLNVVMTRAMKRLYLVGNAQLLSRVPLFRSLLQQN